MPEPFYLDLSDDHDFSIIADIMASCRTVFENSYLDVFGDVVDFVEFKRAGDISPEPATLRADNLRS